MPITRHGLSIGIERIDQEFFLTFTAVGKLTHDDYARITPMIDGALAEVKAPRVKVFLDASELQGWELRAAWDDFKLGLKYGNAFDKVAIFGNKKWQEVAARVGTWFISGEVKFFSDAQAALTWLRDGDDSRE